MTDLPNIQVQSVTVNPNECPVNERLDMTLDFSIDKPLTDAQWKLRFIVDFTFRRQILELATTPVSTYPPGRHHEEFHIPTVDTSQFKQEALLNVGMLTASLCTQVEGKENVILDFNMVVQIAKKGGQLIRCVLSPLD